MGYSTMLSVMMATHSHSTSAHEPPPVKYTSAGLSPLRARVMSLFDDVTDEYITSAVLTVGIYYQLIPD